jgi:alanine racemase
MNLELKNIVETTSGTLLSDSSDSDVVINQFCTDSRKIRNARNSIFIALKTNVRDGHDFIASAYEQGIRVFLVSDATVDINKFNDAHIVLVEDTLRAMQSIAIAHRNKFKIPVYGITGSNGKTIVKEWLARLFSKQHLVLKNPKSYNSQIGVAHAVGAIANHHELAIFEAGISEPNEMHYLRKMIEPTHGIFTMIGAAHDANFDNTKQKIQEKLLLFSNCEKLYYCSDHKLIDNEIKQAKNIDTAQLALITWGKKADADLRIDSIQKEKLETKLRLVYQKNTIDFVLPYTDAAYIENAMHCLLVMLDNGLAIQDLANWFQELPPVEMRLELLKGINNCTVINDTYSSDLASLRIALDFLYEQKQHQHFSLILSDILQHAQQDAIYDAVLEILAQKKLKNLILIGPQLQQRKSLFAKTANVVQHFDSTNDFLNHCDINLFQEEAILIKGAREFALERIVNRLEASIHRTVLRINLSTLLNNVNVFKKRLKPKTKIMAMVKAFAYGSGSFEIAQALEQHGVDYLAVAYVDEGIHLRKNGVRLPILILNPDVASLDAMRHYDLEPEIFSIELLQQFASRCNVDNTKLKIHIKLDTGMHRLGVEEKDLPLFLEKLISKNCFEVKSIFSHLVGSDDMKFADVTKNQRARFVSMCSQIEEKLGYTIIKHLANSAGAVNDADVEFDMVRLGLGLYGISNNSSLQKELRQISTLTTHISQIKHIPKEETVGYSQAGVLLIDSKIATLNIGYADGYSRQFSQGVGKVLINGFLAPVVGNVCMDMIMVDITDIPTATEGQEVTVFGEGLSVTTLAEWMNTIPYDIVAGISPRVKRVFFRE